MNQLDARQRAQVIHCLVEGNSIRSTVRLTGAAKNTVVKLLRDVGTACSVYQDKVMVNLPCRRIQCDEIWSFVYSKAKNVPKGLRGVFGFGDVWTWTALCSDSKVVPCWMVGPRDATTAYHFMHDLKARLKHRVQLTTDGLKAYLEATESAFGAEIDFAQLVKIYGNEVGPKANSPERKYSPAQCMGARKTVISGNPDYRHVSTSHTERHNLTMRMSMRRFTRLTNAFSKKLENHEHALAMYFMFYNFCRIHQTLRVTPAMEIGVADHVWEIEEVVALIGANPP